jgi:NAD(P)-dependent dehydrogenase (short-subunit alcohol dehydrogenase family)
MGRLEGKVILVAGGGGIGGVLARRYASEGAAVVLGDVDLDGARAVVDEISAGGGSALATRLDGADEASAKAAVTLAAESFGGLDGLHANFASFPETGKSFDVLDIPLEAYDEQMRVNARGFLLCTRAALPPILARGGGSIVYTSSTAAYIAEPIRVGYAMSKAAGHALMRHVASRFGPEGVRANTVCPGMIMHDRWPAEQREAMKGWMRQMGAALANPGKPMDIAALGALLMSDEGAFITGQSFTVDGGLTMRP